MNKEQIIEMLCVMCDMTREALGGAIFVDVSGYVRNHCPGIQPEYIEVFRDMLNPIIAKNRKKLSL
jgi:hypothetical protein